jgi:hypothetical protein
VPLAMNPSRREKPPHNAQVLERWAREWADADGVPVARVQRSVSYMVIAAMLDTVRGADGEPLFLIKGGVAMELRLALRARATQDLDAAFRAAAEEMIERLDDALETGYADFTASRTTAQEIGETRAIRVGVKLAYRGRSWATVPLEIASAEGRSGTEFDRVPLRPLDPLGIAVPADILASRCATRLSVRAACVETFVLRATHPRPPAVAIGASWAPAYAQLAAAIGFHVTDVEDAAERVRALVAEIDRAL